MQTFVLHFKIFSNFETFQQVTYCSVMNKRFSICLSDFLKSFIRLMHGQIYGEWGGGTKGLCPKHMVNSDYFNEYS